MRPLTTICAAALLVLIGPEVRANKVAKLHCSDGYSVDVTFSVRSPEGEVFGPIMMNCPPDEGVLLPDGFQYDSLAADGTITDPDGNMTDFRLPDTPPADPPPPPPWVPWGVHPDAPSTYICGALGCVEDPLAPPFIQPGEALLGTFEEGASIDLTVRALDAMTRSPLADALVTVLSASDGSVAASGNTDHDGTQIVSLPAGGHYRIKMESSGFFPQVSDDFYLFAHHAWTMVMPSAADPVPDLQAGDADMDLEFDQLDLIKALAADKYLTGLSATWGEGDWNGAGGEPGDPPPGDGFFDQLDIIDALQAGHYLTGPYGADNAYATVPEPSTLTLLAVGFLALVAFPSTGRPGRHRRNRNSRCHRHPTVLPRR